MFRNGLDAWKFHMIIISDFNYNRNNDSYFEVENTSKIPAIYFKNISVYIHIQCGKYRIMTFI